MIGYPSGSPAHTPISSRLRFRRFESPKQGSHMSDASCSVALARGQSSNGLSQVQFMFEKPVPLSQLQKQHHKGQGE